MSRQHASLTPERWGGFSLDQQIMMIANEMNRAAKLFATQDRDRLGNCYHRVLELVDLTTAVNERPSLRRELLRWRDLIALLYVSEVPEPADHEAAFRCLLRFTSEVSKQIPYLFTGSRH